MEDLNRIAGLLQEAKILTLQMEDRADLLIAARYFRGELEVVEKAVERRFAK